MHDVPYTYSMTARLEGKPSFDATPEFADATQPVLPNRPTSWTWAVKAVSAEGGANQIVVRLFANVKVGDKSATPIEVEVLRHDTKVEVTLLSRLTGWVDGIEAIYKAIGTLVAMAAAVFAWFAGKKWRLRPDSPA